MDMIAVDIADPGLEAKSRNKEFRYILVVIDVATRYIIIRPLQDKSAEQVSNNLLEIFGNFGFPKIIQTDNGK